MKLRWVCLVVLSLAIPAPAQAVICWFPHDPVLEAGADLPSEAEHLRYRSQAFSRWLGRRNSERDVIIVGRFSQNSEEPFFHEEKIVRLRRLFSSGTTDTMMPSQIDYTYRNAFSFDGLQLIDGASHPFQADSIDMRITISEEYEGVVDVLPSTGHDVIGILRSVREGAAWEIDSWICPSYLPIEAAQVEDLLACYNEGACLEGDITND